MTTVIIQNTTVIVNHDVDLQLDVGDVITINDQLYFISADGLIPVSNETEETEEDIIFVTTHERSIPTVPNCTFATKFVSALISIVLVIIMLASVEMKCEQYLILIVGIIYFIYSLIKKAIAFDYSQFPEFKD